MNFNSTYFKILRILILIIIASNFYCQGVNQITIFPVNPTQNDTIYISSDFTYYGNCSAGLVQIETIQNGSNIQILPVYCGFYDTTLCNSIDTFKIEPLLSGNYQINVEYHQGSICPASAFDTILANFDTTIYVGALGEILSKQKSNVHISPNPTNDIISLDINGYNGSVKTELYDLSGRLLKATYSSTISLKDYAKGIYLFKVAYGNVVEEIRVVKD